MMTLIMLLGIGFVGYKIVVAWFSHHLMVAMVERAKESNK